MIPKSVVPRLVAGDAGARECFGPSQQMPLIVVSAVHVSGLE